MDWKSYVLHRGGLLAWFVEVRASHEINVSAGSQPTSNCNLADASGAATDFHDIDADVKRRKHRLELLHCGCSDHLEGRS